MATFCVFLEKRKPCVAEYTGLAVAGGSTSIQLSGSGNPILITTSALQGEIGNTADPGFASSATLTNAKFSLDPAASDKISITFTFDRASPPTEYIIYAHYTVKGTTDPGQIFTPSIMFRGRTVASAEVSASTDPASSSLEYLFHSTDVGENSATFVYEDVAGENQFTSGYIQFGVYSIDVVLDGLACADRCPEKPGFTVGTSSSTTRSSCLYCETALN